MTTRIEWCLKIKKAMLVKKTIITNIEKTSDYLVRWSVRLPFGWSIKLHKILRSDNDRCAHDHPFAFWRLILAGGYWEECGPDNAEVHRGAGNLSYCPLSFRHRILRLDRKASWSLILCGPNNGDRWGFFTRTGYMPYRKFIQAARSARVLWCDDGRVLAKEPEEPPIKLTILPAPPGLIEAGERAMKKAYEEQQATERVKKMTPPNLSLLSWLKRSNTYPDLANTPEERPW
jgi:hypothetical protein